MVNLVADQNPSNRLVPELIQDDFTAGRIVQELEPLLADGTARAEMMAGLAAVRVKLHRKRRMDEAGETAIASVAAVVLETLGLAG
jgi:lipid A disaccharide synthetase